MAATCPRCGVANQDAARFCQNCGESLQPAPPRSRQARKTVTILFSDLVDSTVLGEELDAESLVGVLDRYFASVREVIERHGGVVEKFIGDAVMAAFGLPQMHEDDAVRAVRAAAEMRDALTALNAELHLTRRVRLASRTGINTGVVVVGDVSDGHRLATGDTVNVAARLEQAAPPGGIVLGPTTYRMVRNLVTTQPIGTLDLKGKSGPVEAHSLVAVAPTTDRGAGPAPSQFVGRRRELERIHELLADATEAATTETVLVTGDAGIGKSRLVIEVVARLPSDTRVLTAACRPYGTTSFWPVNQLLASALGLARPLDGSDIEAVTAQLADTERVPIADRVGSLLGLNENVFPLEECFWATTRLLESLGHDGPLVVAIEDVHWAEDALLDLLDRLRMAGAAKGTLLLLTSRPEVLERRWSGHATWHLEIIELDALSRGESDDLIANVLGSAELPAAASGLLTDAAEGNPLFLEQALAAWVEEGVLVDNDGVWTVARPVTEVEVPETVTAILASRLDRLSSDERLVLGASSVAGPVVRRTAVGTMLPDVDSHLVDAAFGSLTAAGLLRPLDASEPTGSDRVAFAHASLRDVAYSITLKSDRATFHERFADWRDRAAEESQKDESVGHHLAEAHRYRRELHEFDAHTSDLALRATRHLVAECERTLGIDDRAAAERLIGEVCRLVEATVGERAAAGLDLMEKVGKLLVTMGHWGDAVTVLTPLKPTGDGPVLRDLGVALCQLHHDDQHSDGYREGQRLLEIAARPPSRDVDAIASFAGTWKGLDDDRAKTLYRRCLELDPSDPYALGNVLEYELAAAVELSDLDRRRPQILEASRRCRSQADAGLNLPWAHFDAGKFALLLGDVDQAIASYAKAAQLATAEHMLLTSMASLRRIEAAQPAARGAAWARTLLALARAARYPSAAAIADLSGTPLSAAAATTPLVMLAGGTEATADEWLRRHAQLLASAFGDFSGLVVSGGTDGGVSGLCGALRETRGDRVRAVGYLPSVLPSHTSIDDRYDELRRTPDTEFSIGQTLQAWSDLVISGVQPAAVRLLAIGGGRVAAAEFRVALGLGCLVGVMAGSGRAADALLGDPDWLASPNLVRLQPDVDALRAFLTPA